ncbi:MAG: Enoyl-(Acyl carrier protein) reductase [Panacagrimonas sp.]|nr:SDR family oxidoreductase [Panacagrimonas sp.]MCC2656015.1 Enoyl-(Acyl carrier protein) reductase [Panacagrimonas sp.]
MEQVLQGRRLNITGAASDASESALASLSPQARIAEPREIAAAVAWLLSSQSRFVTAAVVPIDGGWSTQWRSAQQRRNTR